MYLAAGCHGVLHRSTAFTNLIAISPSLSVSVISLSLSLCLAPMDTLFHWWHGLGLSSKALFATPLLGKRPSSPACASDRHPLTFPPSLTHTLSLCLCLSVSLTLCLTLSLCAGGMVSALFVRPAMPGAWSPLDLQPPSLSLSISLHLISSLCLPPS